MFRGFRARPWAGVDIGQWSVKLVALQSLVGRQQRWAAEVAYGREANSSGKGTGRSPEIVAKAIEAAFSAANLSPRSCGGVSIGIAGPDVILKQVTLPLLDDSEVGSALRFESRKHLPFDPQTMIVDYQVLGRFPSERKLEILLAAVSRDHLDAHLAALRLLDLEPDIVDAAPLALANALGAMEDSLGAHVIVDIGDKASHLVLVQRGQPFFSRRLEFGGDDLTKAIADSASIPLEEAEEWKLAAGSDSPAFRVEWNSPELSSVPEVLRTKLVDEILRSLAFYRTQATLGDVGRMWIAGASARLPGLATRLTELTGIPVAVFDPLAGDRGPTGTPQFAQAFGLALRAS